MKDEFTENYEVEMNSSDEVEKVNEGSFVDEFTVNSQESNEDVSGTSSKNKAKLLFTGSFIGAMSAATLIGTAFAITSTPKIKASFNYIKQVDGYLYYSVNIENAGDNDSFQVRLTDNSDGSESYKQVFLGSNANSASGATIDEYSIYLDTEKANSINGNFKNTYKIEILQMEGNIFKTIASQNLEFDHFNSYINSNNFEFTSYMEEEKCVKFKMDFVDELHYYSNWKATVVTGVTSRVEYSCIFTSNLHEEQVIYCPNEDEPADYEFIVTCDDNGIESEVFKTRFTTII